MTAESTRRSRIRGCLLAGAIGDALGAAVEFDSLETIRQRFGPEGITTYAPQYGRLGAITDDTQMTLFTAEGFIRARQRFADRGICHVPTVINNAYLRWLATQGDHSGFDETEDAQHAGWLYEQAFLHSRRAPGTTCLSALLAGGMGTAEAPPNNSKGCGGVMRVAPIGLAALDPFPLAAEAAALTHGHPSGYLAAGALAELISSLMDGADLAAAVATARARCATEDSAGEVVGAIDHAVTLAGAQNVSTPDAISELGEGWVAEEALSISVYCSLVASDVRDGIVRAVNHRGDSDSTGAITGNILGALHGEEGLPADLLVDLEGRDVIEQLADDLAADGPLDAGRYPPN
jgi:ADP-ribosylglycohydrolase